MSQKPGRSAGQVKVDIMVKVLPKSSRNQIIGRDDGVFKVKLNASPVEGKANKALKGLFAKTLGVPKGSIEIISGERSRKKSIRIHGLSLEKVKSLLVKS